MGERCNMLWIGPRLGRIERACIRSVLRQGHPLTLWTYQRPDGVPDGVDLADAGSVLPHSQIIRHQGGSVALFANRFRYRLQQLAQGIWLDCDNYLVRPIVAGAYLLSFTDSRFLGNAPLKTPPDSPLLPPLLELFEQRVVPPWIPLRARIAAHWRRLTTGRTGLERMPWGVAGPRGLTALVRRHDLMHLVLPPPVFNPYPWQEADWILDPARTLEQRSTEATVGVHLWNERIKGFKEEPAPPGSFLARLHSEGA